MGDLKSEVRRSVIGGYGGKGWHGPAGLALPDEKGRWSVVERGVTKVSNVSEEAALAVISDKKNSIW